MTADAAAARDRLVDRLVDLGYARDPTVVAALRAVPRHLFVPPEARADAYADQPLAIGEGQTISAPHMVALMVDALDARAGHRVLEVGGGSGYHAAVLAELVGPDGRVWAVERHERLARRAQAALGEAGYGERVRVVVADGSLGLPDRAPFDRVSVACAAPAVPPPLVAQLAPGGLLLVPVGDRDVQALLRVAKRPDGSLATEDLGGCRFVPLVGAHGFA